MKKENTKQYDKYIQLTDELAQRGKVLAFVATHVDKGRRIVRISDKLIEDAKKYFKECSDEIPNIIKAGEYITIERNNDKDRTLRYIEEIECDNGLEQKKGYNYHEGKLVGGYIYKDDLNDRRGIHNLEYEIFGEGAVTKIFGHDRITKDHTEHAVIQLENGKLNKSRSNLLELKNQTYLEAFKEIVSRNSPMKTKAM